MKIYTIDNLAMALVACVALLGSTAPASATERTINSAHVTSVMPYPDGSFFVTFDFDHAYCTNANDPKRHYVYVGNGMTAEGAKMLYAAALMALAGGRGVSAAFETRQTPVRSFA